MATPLINKLVLMKLIKLLYKEKYVIGGKRNAVNCSDLKCNNGSRRVSQQNAGWKIACEGVVMLVLSVMQMFD